MPLRIPEIHDYAAASRLEWIETDGIGGVAASTALGASTRKQHAVLSVPHGGDGRVVLAASIQEAVIDGDFTFDLSTNAYADIVYPHGFLALESFVHEPWPTWRYRFPTLCLDREFLLARGEHLAIFAYTVREVDHPVTLVVRPLLAYRHCHHVRAEHDGPAADWAVMDDCTECRPFSTLPSLFITHPDATVNTRGLWYRHFQYERDRELMLECSEDLFHPGYFEVRLEPGQTSVLALSTPRPVPIDEVPARMAKERERRRGLSVVAGAPRDRLFEALLRATDAFTYEMDGGVPGIQPGLPWGEAEVYRGLLAFAGLLLVPRRYDVARAYLGGLFELWRRTPSPARFAPETIVGQMHPADAPLWLFAAAWRYWRASGDHAFALDAALPILEDIARHYAGNVDVRLTADALIEVGHEADAKYAPVLPLGTNALWYNAMRILAEMMEAKDDVNARTWTRRAGEMAVAFNRLFACESRPGLADAVREGPFGRDESLRASQVLAVGLPYCAAENAAEIVREISGQLATPFGLRTLTPRDSRYAGDGRDVKALPKCWSGSVDPTWFGGYCDALKRAGISLAAGEMFVPFEHELGRRGLGHISGAFTGDAPHEPCDCVASASALGEVLRTYAREAMGMSHVV